MMLEQSLISPNFLGKESFRWFIGLVTQYRQTEKGGYKAKVRIIGYHPDSSDIIEDEELPWAHVLVPLGTGSGTGATGTSFNARGSETVIGFFMDGDNGQQPVIIGALFSGYEIQHTNTFDKGTDGFNAWQPNKKPLSSLTKDSKTGKQFNESSTGVVKTTGKGTSGTGTTATESSTQGTKATENKGGNVVNIPPRCSNSKSVYTKLTQALNQFVATLNQITGLAGDITNAVANIDDLISEVALVLSDLFSLFIKKVRDYIVGGVYKLLEDFINSILPKDFKQLTQLATDKIVDAIKCAFYKIIKGLVDFFIDFLTELVDKIISIPLCAVESLVAGALSSVSEQITEAIGPALDELSSLVGGAIGSVNSFIGQALSYASIALNFIDCEDAQCKEQYNYEMNKGWIPAETISDIENVLNYPSNGIQDGKSAATDWLNSNIPTEDTGLTGDCDVTSLECGLPTVTFFGGGGVGAAGLAVVDSIGQVVGVNLTDVGIDYTEAPYISIDDPCGNGAGAQATAVVENGQVTSVIIDNPGYGYLNSTSFTSGTVGVNTATTTATTTTPTDPCSTPLIDSSGSEVTGYIIDVDVIKPGIGYTTGDPIVDTACNTDVEIYPVVDSLGKITGVNIINPGTAIRVLPQLEINSPNGEGAIIRPVLAFKPVEKVGVEINPSKVKKVVLCSEDHGI